MDIVTYFHKIHQRNIQEQDKWKQNEEIFSGQIVYIWYHYILQIVMRFININPTPTDGKI